MAVFHSDVITFCRSGFGVLRPVLARAHSAASLLGQAAAHLRYRVAQRAAKRLADQDVDEEVAERVQHLEDERHERQRQAEIRRAKRAEQDVQHFGNLEQHERRGQQNEDDRSAAAGFVLSPAHPKS